VEGSAVHEVHGAEKMPDRMAADRIFPERFFQSGLFQVVGK
jgi:hypothetical protein